MWAACLQAHLHTDVHRPCICTGEAAAAAAADNGCLHLARQGSTVKRDPRKAKNCGSPPTWLVLSPPSRARLATQRHSGIPGVLPDPRPAGHALDRSASKHGKPMSAKNPPTSVMITERRAKIRKACAEPNPSMATPRKAVKHPWSTSKLQDSSESRIRWSQGVPGNTPWSAKCTTWQV